MNSEQLVLDGLLYAHENNLEPKLGKYLRNINDNKDYLNAS